MMAFVKLSAAIAALMLVRGGGALDNGLAITPQMGCKFPSSIKKEKSQKKLTFGLLSGDNWNSFGCSVSETLLQQTANLIVDYGLKDLGYHYVILDDCWSVGRNGSDNNTLIADPEKFPNGMKKVADDIHDLGLGFGMYSSAGTYTCGRFAGSLGFEDVDAKTWASKFRRFLRDMCIPSLLFANVWLSGFGWEVKGRIMVD